MGAKDFDDLLDKSYLITQISQSDAEIVERLNTKMDSIRSEKEEIESDKNDLLDQKAKLETKMNELDALQLEYDSTLAQLEEDERELLNKKNSNQAEREDLSSQLTQAEADLAAQIAAQWAYTSDPTPDVTNYIDPYSYVSSGSGYCWPAPQCSLITSYWGDDRGHKGVDLATYGSAYGLPIVAAQCGTVTIANNSDEWGDGWGYYIQIDHGNGYATLYAHCSSVIVSVGQYVERGQLIGYIGNTGNSYGAHLHFECWYNGVRYDPMIELG